MNKNKGHSLPHNMFIDTVQQCKACIRRKEGREGTRKSIILLKVKKKKITVQTQFGKYQYFHSLGQILCKNYSSKQIIYISWGKKQLYLTRCRTVVQMLYTFSVMRLSAFGALPSGEVCTLCEDLENLRLHSHSVAPGSPRDE